MKLKVGDWVEIRSKEDILKTLDNNGSLEGLPFMPQMFQYCGQRFKVFKRAHKTCDTVTGTGGRSLLNCIHLDLRCNGSEYGGCQAACLIYWKTAWIIPVTQSNSLANVQLAVELTPNSVVIPDCVCTEADVLRATMNASRQVGEDAIFICQATKIPEFTTYLPWWDIRQYFEDYLSGNASAKQLFNGIVYFFYYFICRQASKISWKLNLVLRWFYDFFQSIFGGLPYPRKEGLISEGQPTPTCELNLQPGEFVRVKPYKVILRTLNSDNKNRGLLFDAEMVPYCGGTYKVRERLSKFIDEKTGKLLTVKSPSILLEGVCCGARYSDCRLLCPKSAYIWWREIWLERV